MLPYLSGASNQWKTHSLSFKKICIPNKHGMNLVLYKTNSESLTSNWMNAIYMHQMVRPHIDYKEGGL